MLEYWIKAGALELGLVEIDRGSKLFYVGFNMGGIALLVGVFLYYWK